MYTVAGMAKRSMFGALYERIGAFAYPRDIRDAVVRPGMRVDKST